MNKLIVSGLALTLVCAFASGVSAAMLDGKPWVSGTLEDFTAYDPVDPGLPYPENISFIGKLLGGGNTPSHAQNNCSIDPWASWNLPQYRGLKDGTNNVVNLQSASATFGQRAAWRGMTAAGPGDVYQRVSFMVKTAMTTPSDYTHQARMSSDASNYAESNGIPGWDVSNLSLRPHARTSWDAPAPGPEWIGPDVDISDGLWHAMDIVYNLTTGDAEWYKDGALVATLPDDPDLEGYFLGRPANYFEFWNQAGGTQAGNTGNAPAVMFDDIATYAALPEPAALVLLSLGSLVVLRRRRA